MVFTLLLFESSCSKSKSTLNLIWSQNHQICQFWNVIFFPKNHNCWLQCHPSQLIHHQPAGCFNRDPSHRRMMMNDVSDDCRLQSYPSHPIFHRLAAPTVRRSQICILDVFRHASVSSTHPGQSIRRCVGHSILSASLRPHKASRRRCDGRHGGRPEAYPTCVSSKLCEAKKRRRKSGRHGVGCCQNVNMSNDDRLPKFAELVPKTHCLCWQTKGLILQPQTFPHCSLFSSKNISNQIGIEHHRAVIGCWKKDETAEVGL